MRLRFAKYEGLGNDFLILDADGPGAATLTPAQVVALCDRHLGVGADGVLVTAARGERAFMRVHNADGSVPEMCGNGIRCAALYLVASGAVRDSSFDIDTDAGPHRCRVAHGGAGDTVEVTMRAPSFDPADVPVRAQGPVVDAPWEVEGSTVRLTAVSMGNPHAVTFDDLAQSRHTLGPALAGDARFPEGVNVGFARTDADGGLTLHVWERGAGWTRACGTGACAAAVAAVRTGHHAGKGPVDVRLPGGTLTITVGGPGEPVRMRGPARHVFEGEIDLEALTA